MPLPDITACVGSDVNIPWVYPDSDGMSFVSWEYIDALNVKTTILLQAAGSAATVMEKYNIRHNKNGNVTITAATVANSGTYRITVTYFSATTPFTDDVVVNVYDPPRNLSFTETPSGSQTTFTCTASSLGDPAADLYIQVNGVDMTSSVSATVSKTDTVKCFLSGPSVQCMDGVSDTVTSLNVQDPPAEAPSPAEDKTPVIISTAVAVCSIAVVQFCCCCCLGRLYCLCRKKKDPRYVVITFDGNWSLGANIGAVCVTKVTPGGPADGKLKVEYQIHDLNGETLTGKDLNKMKGTLKNKTKLTLHISKVGSVDTSKVELNYKQGELLGFDFENLALVTDVTEGSKADGKLKKGERILSINGKSTAGKSIENVNQQLNIPSTAALELTIKRGGRQKNVTLHFIKKASSGIAITKKGEDIEVSAIEPESAAAISGEIQVGDCILSINGVSTAGLKVAGIKEMLSFSIILKVTKDVTLKELDPDNNGSFGFETFLQSTSTSVTVNNQTVVTTVTPEIPANVVKSVTTNGPADLHGIKPGDTVVSINGIKTKGKSQQEIKTMLETFGTSISLKIEGSEKPHGISGHGPKGNDVEIGHISRRAQDSE